MSGSFFLLKLLLYSLVQPFDAGLYSFVQRNHVNPVELDLPQIHQQPVAICLGQDIQLLKGDCFIGGIEVQIRRQNIVDAVKILRLKLQFRIGFFHLSQNGIIEFVKRNDLVAERIILNNLQAFGLERFVSRNVLDGEKAARQREVILHQRIRIYRFTHYCTAKVLASGNSIAVAHHVFAHIAKILLQSIVYASKDLIFRLGRTAVIIPVVQGKGGDYCHKDGEEFETVGSQF